MTTRLRFWRALCATLAVAGLLSAPYGRLRPALAQAPTPPMFASIGAV